MNDEGFAILKEAALWKNRDRIVKLSLRHGETLMAKIVSLPCDCGDCTDDSVIYVHVWSSSKERQEQWEKDRGHVGGYGIPIGLIESVEVAE